MHVLCLQLKARPVGVMTSVLLKRVFEVKSQNPVHWHRPTPQRESHPPQPEGRGGTQATALPSWTSSSTKETVQ